MPISSYSSIFNLTHKAVRDLFDGEIEITEKVDGSQISFTTKHGYLEMRSKGKQLNLEDPEKMFKNGIDQVSAISEQLNSKYTYRGEYLSKPKHNVIYYGRIPKQHIIIFGVDQGEEDYLSHEEMEKEAARCGFEVVPLFFNGDIKIIGKLEELLEKESILGTSKIEGVVIKNYNKFGPDKKVLMGKFVSEKFKESHQNDWKKNNKTDSRSIIDSISDEYTTEARWEKAISHLRDNGEIIDDMRDVGKLMKEISVDIERECKDNIKDELWAWAWPQIKRRIGRGFPEWYKKKLMGKLLDYVFGIDKNNDSVW